MAAEVRHLPSLVRTRIIPADGRGGTLEQTSWLTPYDAETIAQAALRAGPGARLEVTVSPTVSAASFAAVNALFAWLLERGIAVTVQRGDENGSG